MDCIGEFAVHVVDSAMPAPADTRIVQRQVAVPYPADRTVSETLECVNCDYGPCAQACIRVNRFSHSGPQCPSQVMTNVQHQCPEITMPVDVIRPRSSFELDQNVQSQRTDYQVVQRSLQLVQSPRGSGDQFGVAPDQCHVECPGIQRGELHEPFPPLNIGLNMDSAQNPCVPQAPGFLLFRGVKYLPEPEPSRVGSPGENSGNS